MHYINSVVIKPEAMVLWKGRLTVLNCHTRMGLSFPFYNLMYAPIMCHTVSFLFRQHTIYHMTFCCIFHPVERLSMIMRTDGETSSPNCFQSRDQIVLYQNLEIILRTNGIPMLIRRDLTSGITELADITRYETTTTIMQAQVPFVVLTLKYNI